MNTIDLIFILLVLGGLALGFFQGTIKLIIAIISFYVSIILASLYFQVSGVFFRQQFNLTMEVGSIIAFGVILLISFLLLMTAGLYTFRYAKMPPSLDFFDRIVGTLFGLVMICLFLGILALILKDLFIYRDVASTVTFPIMHSIQSGVRTSIMVQFFSTSILPLIYTTIRPVLPSQSELIFRIR